MCCSHALLSATKPENLFNASVSTKAAVADAGQPHQSLHQQQQQQAEPTNAQVVAACNLSNRSNYVSGQSGKACLCMAGQQPGADSAYDREVHWPSSICLIIRCSGILPTS